MGYLQALDIQNYCPFPLEAAIQWYLRCNHFPAVPSDMVPIAIRAVKKAKRERWDDIIITPYSHKLYGNRVPVHVIVENLHLDAFVKYLD